MKLTHGGVIPVSAVLADKDVMLCIQPGVLGRYVCSYHLNKLCCLIFGFRIFTVVNMINFDFQ